MRPGAGLITVQRVCPGCCLDPSRPGFPADAARLDSRRLPPAPLSPPLISPASPFPFSPPLSLPAPGPPLPPFVHAFVHASRPPAAVAVGCVSTAQPGRASRAIIPPGSSLSTPLVYRSPRRRRSRHPSIDAPAPPRAARAGGGRPRVLGAVGRRPLSRMRLLPSRCRSRRATLKKPRALY